MAIAMTPFRQHQQKMRDNCVLNYGQTLSVGLRESRGIRSSWTSFLPTTEHPEDKSYAMSRQKPGASTTRRVRSRKTCFGADLERSWWAAVLVACAPDWARSLRCIPLKSDTRE
jgi:hypothetical protein